MSKITIRPGDTFTFNSERAILHQWRNDRSVCFVEPAGYVSEFDCLARHSKWRDITRADALVLLRVYGVEVCEETPMPVVKVTHGLRTRNSGVLWAVGDEKDCREQLEWSRGHELVRLDFGGAA